MDGKYYIKLSEKGQFLHNKSNISLIFNTDGAPLYSSSSVSLWPVFLAVNELPSPDRFVMKVLMNNTVVKTIIVFCCRVDVFLLFVVFGCILPR